MVEQIGYWFGFILAAVLLAAAFVVVFFTVGVWLIIAPVPVLIFLLFMRR